MLAKVSTFRRDKNGAIGMLFAICLLPMVLLIALAIDFSFFTEARSQVQIASDAAATHAIRAATGTYALETADGVSNAQATSDAIAAGDLAGSNWFAAQLGSLPTASVPLSASNPNVQVTNTSNPSGFSAAVTYAGFYPPFFDHLFNTTANWNIAGSSGAASQYSYVQIMMMLDTSQSMDIADSPANILKLEDYTVCIPKTEVPVAGDGMSSYYGFGTVGSSTNINFQPPNVPNYTPRTGSQTDTSGSCAGGALTPAQGTSPNSPCAFACHTTASTANFGNGTYPADLYGLARSLGVRLRIDDVFSAAENVVSSMIDTEQASDQFAIGVYQFNDNISGDKDAVGNTIAQIAPGDGTNGNYEATYNLTTALSNLKAIDYNVTPSETSFPPLTDESQDNDHKNFPQSVADFIRGDATNNVPLKSVTTSTQGLTIANPVKDIFIVTDGMEDSPKNSSIGHSLGEMTSVTSETNQTANAICQNFKNLHFTVYVLYIPYNDLPNQFYANVPLTDFQTSLDSATALDYPSIYSTQLLQPAATGASASDTSLTPVTPAPDQAALAACASITNGVSDLYVANNDQQINTQLSAMLKSALSGAIRITN